MDISNVTKNLIEKFTYELKRADLRAGDSSDEWQNIRKLLIKIANSIRQDISGTKIPIKLDPYCKLRKIHIIERNIVDEHFESELIPERNGFKVYINSKLSETRKRATIAHEIGHTFFYDISTTPPSRFFKMIDYYLYLKKDEWWPKEEWLSWNFAAELLVPSDIFNKMVDNQKFSLTPNSIIKLSKKFKVSPELIIRRGMELKKWNNYCIFICDTKFDEKSFFVHKGNNFPQNITIYGKNGLITSDKIKKVMLKKISKDPFSSHEITFSVGNTNLKINFCKYSSYKPRIIGVCESNPNLIQKTLI